MTYIISFCLVIALTFFLQGKVIVAGLVVAGGVAIGMAIVYGIAKFLSGDKTEK